MEEFFKALENFKPKERQKPKVTVDGKEFTVDIETFKEIQMNGEDQYEVKAGKIVRKPLPKSAKKGYEIFQIQFDTNLHESLNEEANYSDYKSEIFSVKKEDGKETNIISDINNQIDLKSDSIQIYQHSFTKGTYDHEIGQDRFHSIFIQYGRLKINDQTFNSGDFLIVESEVSLSVEILSDTKVFEIISPTELPYKTYAEMHNIS